jgi:hypothetical protein
MTSATTMPAGSWVVTTGPNTNVGQVGISNANLVSHQGGPFGATAKPHNYTNSIELKENEAFNTDVQTLSDLWLAKWGNEWVDLTELHEDRFWSIAYERLKQLGMIEQHYLTDRAMHVCRRPK